MVDTAVNVEKGGDIVIEAQDSLSSCESEVVPVHVLLGDSSLPHVVKQALRNDTWEGSFNI